MKRLITFSLLLTPEFVLSPFDRLEGYEHNGFHKVLFDEKACWISAKYSSLR